MKRSFSIAISLAALALFSGCSLSSPIQSGDSSKIGSIWRSSDGGKTWGVKNQPAGKTNLSDIDVLSIAVSPSDPNVVFFGTRGNGIIKTSDGGENLETTSFISEKVYGLEISPANADVVYASGVWQGRGKIFKSSDRGENWEEIYTAPASGPLIVSLTIDKNSPSVIYASTSDNQIIKTTDGGATWKNIFSGSNPILKIAVDKGNSNLIYFAANGGIIERSKDGGVSFEDISKQALGNGMGNLDLSTIIADPYNNNWVYAAGGAGILRSKNAGESWEKINILDNPKNFPVKTLAINPANSREMIYGASQAVYKSTDDGANWATFQFTSSKSAKVLKYSVSDPNIVYLGLSK